MTLPHLVGRSGGAGTLVAVAVCLLSAVVLSTAGCGRDAEAVHLPAPTGYVMVKQGAALVLKSEEEKRAQELLDSRISLDFEDEPLGNVIAAISKEKGVSIRIDLSLVEEGIDAQTPVSVQVRDVSVQSALEVLMRPFDGAFFIDNGVVYLATSDGCEEQQALRFYYVKPLVGARAVAAPPELLLGWSEAQAGGNTVSDGYDVLIKLIKTMAEPDSWDDVGGPGSIEKLPRWHCLLIDQTEDVHRQIVEVFKMLDTLPQT